MAGHTVIVSVLADTKKFSRAMRTLANETGLTKLGNGFKTVGSRLAGMAKTGVKATAAIAAGIAALAIKGGFERAMKIEDAQAKLKGLGHDAKNIDQIMTDALASVKGTAYGLDTAATVASTAVAAGIKPGKELEKYLRLTADAATIAGTSMDEMGSILNKTTTSGKVMTRELRQLSDRGLPVFEWLAEAYEVSADELQKMVSRGEIDAEKFRKIMEEKIGGAALESGNTTRGAFENMKAALSRVGVALLEDVFPKFKDLFNGITKGLDDLTDAVKPVGEAFNEWLDETAIPAVKRLGEWLRDDLWPVIKNVANTLRTALASAVDTVKDALDRAGFSAEDTAESFGDTLLNAAEKAAGAIAWVVEKLGDFSAWVIDHKDDIKNLALIIGGATAAFMGLEKVITITRAAMAVFNLVMAANPITLVIIAVALLVGAFVMLYNESEEVREAVDKLWDTLKDAWERIWPSLKPVLEKMGELFEALVPILADLAVEFIENLLPKIERFADEAIPVLEKVADALDFMTNALDTDKWDDDWSLLQKSAKKSSNEIQEGLSIMTMAMRGDFKGLMDKIQRDANEKLPRVQARLSRWGDNIKNITGRATDWIKNKWSTGWNDIASLSSNIFGRIGDSARQRFNSLVEFMRGIPGRIRGVFASAGTWLASAGRAIIDGLVRGIRGAFDRVRSTLNELTSFLPSWKGPEAVDKKLLVKPGQWIMEGLLTGILGQVPALKRTLGGVGDTIAATRFEPLQASLDARTRHASIRPAQGPVEATIDGPLRLDREDMYALATMIGNHVLAGARDVSQRTLNNASRAAAMGTGLNTRY